MAWSMPVRSLLPLSRLAAPSIAPCNCTNLGLTARRTGAGPTTTTTTTTTTSTVYRLQQVRHEASARRHTKKLRIHPHPSFKPSSSSSSPSAMASGEGTTRIVYNPPSSAPTPYMTPKAFLPQGDPRLSIPSLAPPEPVSKPTLNTLLSTTPPLKKKLGPDGLPPPLRPYSEKKYHLKPNQIEKIKKLRDSNPDYWTRDRLAGKYKCSQFFVGMVAPVSKERAMSEFAKIDAIKAKWGKGRQDARKERARRRRAWGKDLV